MAHLLFAFPSCSTENRHSTKEVQEYVRGECDMRRGRPLAGAHAKPTSSSNRATSSINSGSATLLCPSPATIMNCNTVLTPSTMFCFVSKEEGKCEIAASKTQQKRTDLVVIRDRKSTVDVN